MATNENVITTCINAFIDYELQFLNALVEVYPEDTNLKASKLEFTMATQHAPENLREAKKEELLQVWNQFMGPLAQACQQKNAEVVMKAQNFPPYIQKINIEEKWQEVDEETREVIWQYLNELQKYSQMYLLYKAVPSNMMQKIQTMAMGMAEQMKTGEMNANDLNIEALSQRVTQEINESDIQDFAANMMGNMDSVGSLLGSMMQQPPQ
jgi:hypothetical protein